MIEGRRFTDLLLQNENWILTKMLEHCKNSKTKHSLILSEKTWKETIKAISDSIIDSYLNNPDVTSFMTKRDQEDPNLLTFAKSEVHKCRKNKIYPNEYLSSIKYLGELYYQLVIHSKEPASFKQDFCQFILIQFNRIELLYIHLFDTIKADKNAKTYETEILNSIPFPCLLVNEHRLINRFNHAFNINFNPNNVLIYKLDLQSLIPPTKSPKLFLNLQKIIETQVHKIDFELEINKIPYLVSIGKHKTAGTIMLTFINIKDWQEKETQLNTQKQQAEESNRLKSVFLANMSHEIRTPLNAIIGFAELIGLCDNQAEERQDFINLIKKSSSDLLNLIDDVIDIAKIESKQLKIVQSNVNLLEMYVDLVKIYEDILIKHDKRNVKLKVNITEQDKDLVIRTDPKRLKQVLSNLIGNAIKFTTKGQIEIGYKLAPSKIVYFYVKDTGVGIPKNKLNTIFERYGQVEDTYQSNINGTGLGLAISKSIIQLMGGNIWATSKVNKGANFYFYLPHIPPKKEQPNTQLRADVMPETLFDIDLKEKTILIAEDENTNYSYINALLKPYGAKTIRAKTGIEAISQVETNEIDLVLMDIRMPVLDGIEASRYILTMQPDLPIVAISAFAMDEDRRNCINAGCKEFLPKPLQKENFFTALKTILENNKIYKPVINLPGIKE